MGSFAEVLFQVMLGIPYIPRPHPSCLPPNQQKQAHGLVIYFGCKKILENTCCLAVQTKGDPKIQWLLWGGGVALHSP